MMTDQMKLEKSTLKRLTTERREHGSVPSDTQKILTTLGVFWDEIGQDKYGPYKDKEEARVMLEEYCIEVLGI